jgi:hypothetical protein
MLLGSPRYYPKAQIRQGADRISAPTRRTVGDSGPGLGHNARAARSASCLRELCPKSRLPPLSLRWAPSAGKPLANTVSECEANDQSDCSFQH